MSAPFVAEIRMWGCSFAPYGWAFCDGQTLAISQNTALFSLIGTYYGGDGHTYFNLPSLQGRVPMFWGQGPGLSPYIIGEPGGVAEVMLTDENIPDHSHALQASPLNANLDKPAPSNALARTNPQYLYKQPAGAGTPQLLAPDAVKPTGAGLPHNNMMPYETVNFCIALQGIYPPRS